MPNTILKMRTNVYLATYDSAGQVVEGRWAHNLIPLVGLIHVADRMLSASSDSTMSHVAIGLGGTATSSGDTVLEEELTRVALTSLTREGSELLYLAQFLAGTGTGNLQEAGIFNSAIANDGTLLARVVFATINKESDQDLLVWWVVGFLDDEE